MKGFLPLFLGIFGTFALSWAGLTVIPNAQIGHLDPQMDEEATDVYPMPKSGMADHGREVYVSNGCVYCHSQQIRPDYAASDVDRKWGARRSAPRDYLFERPALIGKMRMGPDLSNVGKRAPVDDENAPSPGSTNSVAAAPSAPGATPAAPGTATVPVPVAGGSPAAPPAPADSGASPAPATTAQTAVGTVGPISDVTVGAAGIVPLPYSAAWHHRHLYQPRSISPESNMPSYRFLYEKRRIGGQPSADALKFNEPGIVETGSEIVPTYDAKCLVAYLMTLDQSHALTEVKSSAAAAPPAPGNAVK